MLVVDMDSFRKTHTAQCIAYNASGTGSCHCLIDYFYFQLAMSLESWRKRKFCPSMILCGWASYDITSMALTVQCVRSRPHSATATNTLATPLGSSSHRWLTAVTARWCRRSSWILEERPKDRPGLVKPKPAKTWPRPLPSSALCSIAPMAWTSRPWENSSR